MAERSWTALRPRFPERIVGPNVGRLTVMEAILAIGDRMPSESLHAVLFPKTAHRVLNVPNHRFEAGNDLKGLFNNGNCLSRLVCKGHIEGPMYTLLEDGEVSTRRRSPNHVYVKGKAMRIEVKDV
jgi:hypothetical protein